MPRSSCTVVLHHRGDSTGCLPEVLAQLGLEPFVTSVDELPDPAAVEHAIVLGSPESAYDERLPWLASEQAWLRELISRSVPIFGICFGSQALARALGGNVYRNHVPEIGWSLVDTVEPDLVAAGPWLNFHFDAFSVPEGAGEIASTSLAPQAYRQGRWMGVQFHPEITEAMFRSWQEYWNSSPATSEMLTELGDLPERLLDEIASRADESKEACSGLISGFLARTAQS